MIEVERKLKKSHDVKGVKTKYIKRPQCNPLNKAIPETIKIQPDTAHDIKAAVEEISIVSNNC